MLSGIAHDPIQRDSESRNFRFGSVKSRRSRADFLFSFFPRLQSSLLSSSELNFMFLLPTTLELLDVSLNGWLSLK